MAKKPRKDGRREQYAMAKVLDQKAEFDEFRSEILPKIRKMLRDGKKADEIYRFAESYAAARTASLALGSENENIALAASKEIREHASGKAVARQETTHKFEKLADEELDALLNSRLKDVQDGPRDEDPSGVPN